MSGQWANAGWPKLRVMAATISFTACALLASQSGQAQPRITEVTHLRIASWNLEDAVAAGVVARQKPVARSWRNTFGAERRVEAKPTFAADRLKADVVLLQGVRSVRQVRKIFPARDWKLILSRQILKLGNGRLSRDTQVSGEATITAVAVRYQLRLRVTGTEHLSDLDGVGRAGRETEIAETEPDSASADGAGSTPGEPPSQPPSVGATENDGEPFPDGLALRLSHSGSPIWVVSVVLPTDCRLGSETCLPARRLKDWADGKRAEGVGVVIGGKLDSSLRKAGPSGVCAEQEIVADRGLQAETGADTVAGCVAFVDVEGRS